MYRFWSKVAKQDVGCWEWTAYRNKAGYGRFMLNANRCVRAHRLAYELTIGPIPEGLMLDHLCCNPACVRPDHLEPVTNGENQKRGTGWVADLAAKTRCPQGHAYTETNLRPGSKTRACRQCHRDRERERSRRKRGSTRTGKRKPALA